MAGQLRLSEYWWALLPLVSFFSVLGCRFSWDLSEDVELARRVALGWAAFYSILGQLQQKHVSLQKRLELLDSVVRSVIFWGLNSTPLHLRSRKYQNSVHRRMVVSLLRIKRRPGEEWLEHWRRSYRVAKQVISDRSTPWSQAYRYRYFYWWGHVARLDSSHLLQSVFRFRSLACWRHRQSTFRHSGPPEGRHKGKGVQCCVLEKVQEQAWRRFYSSPGYDRVVSRLVREENGFIPLDWVDLAQHRDAWRGFSRWYVFRANAESCLR